MLIFSSSLVVLNSQVDVTGKDGASEVLLDTNLIAHWPLDETSGDTAYDMTGQHNGARTGATINQPGRVGTSYRFNGFDQRIAISNHNDFNFVTGEDFSIYTWIKTTMNDYGYFIDKRSADGSPGYFMRIMNDGTLDVRIKTTTGSIASITGIQDIADGQWHHVGMVRSGNTLEAFVDGVSVGTNDSADGDLSNSRGLFIGVNWDYYWDYHGYIDDIRIYNKPTVPLQILSTQPQHNSTKTNTSQVVKVFYSWEMNTMVTPSLNQTNGTLVNYTFLGWDSTYTDNDTAIWTHDDWAMSDIITLKVNNATDILGNNLIEPYNWTFTISPAVATGPIGTRTTNFGPFDVKYEYNNAISSVEIYWSNNSGINWFLAGTDPGLDGNFSWTAPDNGDYWWMARSNPEEPIPSPGDSPEAGPYTVNICTATATGPVGAGAIVEIEYVWSGNPTAVRIYWTKDNNMTWNGPIVDTSIDGSHFWYPLHDGVYWWYAVTIPTSDEEASLPVPGTPAEAGPYVVDILEGAFTLMKGPFMSDVHTVGFRIAGVCNVSVDVEVEVGTVDFLPGAGNVGVFTGVDGIDDNYATGAFRIECPGLVEGVQYYYRVKMTNGADSIYYPNATITSGPHNIGVTSAPTANPGTLMQVQDRPTNTNQPQFLCSVSVANTWPLSLITDGTGIAAFTNNNLRDKTTGMNYQSLPGDNYYLGAWGMWDDGTGMDFWHNDTQDGVYVGNPAPFAAVKTDKFIPQKTATATGPVGTGGADVTITYDHIGYSSESEPSPLLPEPSPEPSTVPMIKVDPFVTDVYTVTFTIAGVCDIAVDVEVEVGTVPDFAIGTGSVGVFTTAEDNYVTGAFRVLCSGLVEGTQYHWRATITSGADIIYYPSIASTEGPENIGVTSPVPINPSTLAQVQDRPTNTNQGVFLCTVSVANTWPLSLITDGAGIAAFTNNNLRDKTTGILYQSLPGDNYYVGAWGMWDDGSGMAFWHNETEDGVYVGDPIPFAQVKTDKEPPPPPDEIELYYSTDSGANWQLAGNDTNVNGSFPWTCLSPGTYHWIANSVGGNDDVGIPAPGTLPEAGPYINGEIIDIPLIEGWNLVSLPLIQLNESIDQVLNSIAGKWDCIQVYDPLSPEPWKSNNVYRPDQLDDFNTLNHIQGFWINITEPGGTTLSAFGWDLASTSIPLYAGWNLVGYPTLNYTTTVAEALFGTGADHVEVFDPAEPYRIKEVPPTYIMQPGEGYWVHVPIDTIWTIDW